MLYRRSTRLPLGWPLVDARCVATTPHRPVARLLNRPVPAHRRIRRTTLLRQGSLFRWCAPTLIGGPDGWHAVNTDVPGAVNALAERGITAIESVRFLGGGATVDSLRLAVRELGATRVEVWLRDPSKLPEAAGVTVHHLDDPIDGPVDLLISTIPS